VKHFINFESTKYDIKTFKVIYKSGADPNIYFKDAAGQTIEKIAVASLDSDQIVELLKSKGIHQRPPKQEEKKKEL